MAVMESVFFTPENIKTLIIVGIVIALVIIYVVIRDKLNRKKAQNGEDREKVWNIIEKNVPDAQNYTCAYADWEWTTYQGRRSTTKYWHYAIAFNQDRLYVLPLSTAGGDINHTGVYKLEKSDIAFVNGNFSQKGKKNIAPWVEFYDAALKELLSITVSEEYLHDDRYHPVNILQPDESQAFAEWRDSWMSQINPVGGVPASEIKKNPIKKKKK